jgi:hypothetical protein
VVLPVVGPVERSVTLGTVPGRTVVGDGPTRGSDTDLVEPVPTVAALLARCLAAQGVSRVFRTRGHGLPDLPGLGMVDVPSDELSSILADADGRLVAAGAQRPGVALLTGDRLRLSSQPGADVPVQLLTEASSLPLAIAGWSLGEVHAAVEYELAVDLGSTPPAGLEPVAVSASSDQLVTLSPTLASFRTVLVVGPGVARAGHHAAVAEAARMTGAGVVATPGAVGVLSLDHPSWLGVVGLQVDDPVRSGLLDAELIITVGVDPAEAPELPDSAQVLDVEPWHLAMMAGHWPEPDEVPAGSDLTRALAELVSAPGDAEPLVRATGETLALLPDGGLVAADAGVAGLWLARGLVPSRATVVVPAHPAPGFAAAAALVAALDDRPALAVVTTPVDPLTEQLVDVAASRDLPLVVEVWGARASPGEEGPDDGSGLVRRLQAAVGQGGRSLAPVPVDLDATQVLLDVAGPVVAWSRPG